MRDENILSAEQESLLMRFYDGECSLIERGRVKGILARSETARDFLELLASGSAGLKARKEEVLGKGSCDLWERISVRIDQEERAELLLGRREIDSPKRRFSLDLANLGWGFSGALVTAGIAAIVIQSGYVVSKAPRVNLAKGVAASQLASEQFGAENVSLNDRGVDERLANSMPLSATHRFESPLEVDWMRSDGRVHMIQDPNERSAIIWVKRKSAENRRRDEPIMLNDRVPQTVQVVSTR